MCQTKGSLMQQGSVELRRKRLRTRVGALAIAGATCFVAVAGELSPAGAAPIATHATSARKAGDGLAPVAVQALSQLRSYVRSGDASTWAGYQATRTGIAVEIANRLGIDAIALEAAWNAADVPHQIALMAAFTQLGVPYRRNQSREGVGFDCSGLFSYAWSAAGTTLTRQSAAQIRAAAPRDQNSAQAGDLVYYPGHSMMYLGVGNAIVHAPYTGRNVEVDTIAHRRGVRFGDPTG